MSKKSQNQKKSVTKHHSSHIITNEVEHKANSKLPPDAVVVLWVEACRTIRWGVVSATIVASLGLLVWGVVAVNSAQEPWWKVLLFTTAPPLSVMGTVLILLRKRMLKIIGNFSDRNRNLEMSVDDSRTSSELQSNGKYHDD